MKAIEILSYFLSFHKLEYSKSNWKPYLDSLPENYSTLSYCTSNEKLSLPLFLREIVKHQDEEISVCFEKLLILFKNFPINYNLDINIVQWAWYTVNTRAVYLKTDISNEFLIDDDILALAPYLDLLNHSNEANISAGLNSNFDAYEIVTYDSYKPYNEVFISYGPHDNVRLLTEYGFVLHNNPHDCVKITVQDIILGIISLDDYIDIERKTCFEKKRKILNENLNLKLCGICNEGATWTLKACVVILTMYPEQLSTWSLIYKDNPNYESVGICCINDYDMIYMCIKKIVELKFSELNNNLITMETFSCKTESFLCAILLVKEMIKLLHNTLNLLK